MGGDVEEVTSYATQSANPVFAAYEYPTTSTTILKFKNGSVGKCAAVVDCLQPYYFHTHLVGSEGSLLDNKFHSQKLAGLNAHAWSQLSMKMLDSGDVADHPYQTQFQAFFDALDAGKDMPLTSFADGFATHRVIAAADRSAAEGRPVKLGSESGQTRLPVSRNRRRCPMPSRSRHRRPPRRHRVRHGRHAAAAAARPAGRFTT